jgi:hypothetical protein
MAGWVFKFNDDGSIAWQNSYDTTERKEDLLAIHPTDDGGYIALGRTSYYDDLVQYYNNWLLKLDGEGNLAHNMAVLRDFVQECKERNIHVILFTPPAWHTYRDNLNKMKLDVVVGKAESLATNNSNVEYLNLLEDSQFYSDDFHDADHLAGKGARKLTILLDKFAVGLLNL